MYLYNGVLGPSITILSGLKGDDIEWSMESWSHGLSGSKHIVKRDSRKLAQISD